MSTSVKQRQEENGKSNSRNLKWYIEKCGESANRKGWFITWEHLPEYLMATIHELTDGFDTGWRDDDETKMSEEIADCIVRLFHICHDLNIPIEDILTRIMEENEKRPHKHGRKRM